MVLGKKTFKLLRLIYFLGDLTYICDIYIHTIYIQVVSSDIMSLPMSGFLSNFRFVEQTTV